MNKLIFLLIFSLTNLFSQPKETKSYNLFNDIWSHEWRGDDKKLDSLKIYYRNGNINEEFYFDENGRLHGSAKKYNHKNNTEIITEWFFNHGKLISEKFNFHEKNENVINMISEIEENETGSKINMSLKMMSLRAKIGQIYLPIRSFRSHLIFLTKNKQRFLQSNQEKFYHNFALTLQALQLIYSNNLMINNASHYSFFVD